MNRIVTAAALAAALWGFKRWLDQRYVRAPALVRNPTESWENEGGALVTHPARFDAPQVPR